MRQASSDTAVLPAGIGLAGSREAEKVVTPLGLFPHDCGAGLKPPRSTC